MSFVYFEMKQSGKSDPLDSQGISWFATHNLVCETRRDYSRASIGVDKTTGVGLVLYDSSKLLMMGRDDEIKNLKERLEKHGKCELVESLRGG